MACPGDVLMALAFLLRHGQRRKEQWLTRCFLRYKHPILVEQDTLLAKEIKELPRYCGDDGDSKKYFVR